MSQAVSGEAWWAVPRIKVTVPDVPRDHVHRQRLLVALDRVRAVKVTLVCGPAGSGKTRLLADWVQSSHARDVAWVSLDPDDNDDRRFWSAILAAFSAAPAVPAESPIRQLAVPTMPSSSPRFMTAVLDALSDVPGVISLVLDGVHELHDPQPLSGLESILRDQPHGLRLILSSQHDPPLPLRSKGLAEQLTEIRAEELRFSVPEARAFLEAAGVELDEDQLRRLVARTEGWAAGLRLAAMSLRETDDPDRLLTEFAENDRLVAAYLADEVLSRLHDTERELLLAVSVCEEVSGDLARTLSGRTDAGTTLERLARQSIVVSRVSRSPRWYRVHRLVRSSLLAGLVRQWPARAAELQRHASDWFAQHDQPRRALDHAIQARDAPLLTEMLRRQALTLSLAGDHGVLGRALNGLGEKIVAGDSLLALVSALHALDSNDLRAADLHLDHADAAWPAQPSRELAQLYRIVLAWRAELAGDIDEMTRTVGELETLRPTEPPLDALAMLHRGTALLAAGRRDVARNQLEAALAAARRNGQRYVVFQCHTIMGVLAGVLGEFRSMTVLAETICQEAEERGWQQTVPAAIAHSLLACRALLSSDPAECARQLRRADWSVDADDPAVTLSLPLLMSTLGGAARFETGDSADGLRQLAETRTRAPGARFVPEQVALAALLEHRASLRFGASDVAGDALAWSQDTIPESGEVVLMRARTQLSLGRYATTSKLLEPLLDGRVSALLPWSIIDAWLAEAEAATLAGDRARAHEGVRSALGHAHRLDVTFPLVFATPTATELLSELAGDADADRVLANRYALHGSPLTVTLTRRERNVLRLLPTLRSLDEIAQDLTVSPNTVKTHVRSIYQKLGVRKRRDAVAVARERGLLDTSNPEDAL